MRKLTTLSFLRKDVKRFVLYGPLLLLLLLLQTGSGLYAQDNAGDAILSRKISYEASHAPLSKVLKDIREKTKVRFTYNTEVINRQPAVTVKAENVSLETLLKQVLTNTNLLFDVAMEGVVIYETDRKQTKDKIGVIVWGRVTDQADHPLAGVSIKGLTTKDMTVTESDGAFMLVVPTNEQIGFSRIGMKSFVYNAGTTNKGPQAFKMDSVVQVIQEVVVNGYQKIDPRLFTGSVTKLSAAEVLQAGQPSIDKMLQGKVPGLMVLNTSGGVNAKPTLRIRGTSTLLGNASPLWVVDGMIRPEPVDISNALLNNLVGGTSQSNYELIGNAISGLNPYDIESLTFLKDAAATAIYGTRAANGVIVVTTKRGKAGPMQVSYNSSYTFQQRPSYKNLNLMNSKERIELSNQLLQDGVVFQDNLSGFPETVSYEGLYRALYKKDITEAQFRDKVAQMQTRNTDWFKLLFRNQFSLNQSLSMSGGAGKTVYYASFNYADNKSAAKLDGNKQYGVNVDIRTQVGKRLNLDLSVMSNYTTRTGYYNGISPLAYAMQTSRAISPDDYYPIAAGQPLPNQYMDNMEVIRPYLNPPLVFNFQNEINHTSNTTTEHTTSANLQLDYNIGKGFTFRNQSSAFISGADGMAAYDQLSFQAARERGWNQDWTPPDDMIKVSPLPAGGVANTFYQRSLVLNTKNSIDYSNRFFNDRDQFNFTIGNEINSVKREGTLSTQAGYFPERGKTFFPSDLSRKKNSYNITDGRENSVGIYSTIGYSLMGRYTVYGTIRMDGSNRFGQYSNSKFLPNYDISARWDVSSESWFPTNVISGLMIRSSYGTQGNVVTAVGPNLVAGYMANTGVFNPRNQLPYLHIKSLPYPDLRWEKTYHWDIGADMGLFNNRARIGFDYYSKHSVDVLDNVEIPYEYGMNTMYRNNGSIYNKGFELTLNLTPVRTKNSELNLSFNTSKQFNKLSDDVNQGNFYSLFDGNGHLRGRPISGFYSYKFKGLNPDNGLPLFDKLDQKAKTSNPDDILVYSGQIQPKLTFGFTPSFRYRSFAARATFIVSLGSTKRLNSPFVLSEFGSGVPAPYSNTPRSYFDRWRKPGDELKTNIPSVIDNPPHDQWVHVPYYKRSSILTNYGDDITIAPMDAYTLSDIRTISNDYMRCTSLSLMYTVPPPMLRGTGIKGLNASLTIANLFKIANRRLNGQDPEISDFHSAYGTLPLTRSYTLGLSASF
ncbi:archease [Chitinophaga sp. HK235]|uniref:archease n=1 Tax=Chitinophaga sp. HK235 TaxID=2952571 RepID=UPI001BA8603B|nr:archease [Chitinophaga sp. HK235]